MFSYRKISINVRICNLPQPVSCKHNAKMVESLSIDSFTEKSTLTYMNKTSESFLKNSEILSSWCPLINSKILEADHNVFLCADCTYLEQKIDNIVSHVEIHHIPNFPGYKCKFCAGIVFKTYIVFKDHIEKYHMRENLLEKNCSFCTFTSKQKLILEQHIMRTHTEFLDPITGLPPPPGETRSRAADEDEFMTDEYSTDPAFINSCEFCDFSTPMKTNYVNHMKTHGVTIKPHKCKLCNYRCLRKARLKNHLKMKHNIGDDQDNDSNVFKNVILEKRTQCFKCIKCDFFANTEDELKVHDYQEHFIHTIGDLLSSVDGVVESIDWDGGDTETRIAAKEQSTNDIKEEFDPLECVSPQEFMAEFESETPSGFLKCQPLDVQVPTKLIYCKMCGTGLTKRCQLLVHMENFHGIFNDKRKKKKIPFSGMYLIICKFCTRRFKKKCSYTQHLTKDHSDEDIELLKEELAKNGKENIQIVKREQSRMDLEEEGEFPCGFCDEIFKLRSVRREHEAGHNGIYVKDRKNNSLDNSAEISYEKCMDELSETAENAVTGPPPVAQQIRRRGRPVGKRRSCDCANCLSNSGSGRHLCHYTDCLQSFTKTAHLDAHLLNHLGLRPFVCPVTSCGASFTRGEELKRHTRTLHEEGRFQCRVCGRRYHRTDHFKLHQKNCEQQKISHGANSIQASYINHLNQAGIAASLFENDGNVSKTVEDIKPNIETLNSDGHKIATPTPEGQQMVEVEMSDDFGTLQMEKIAATDAEQN